MNTATKILNEITKLNTKLDRILSLLSDDDLEAELNEETNVEEKSIKTNSVPTPLVVQPMEGVQASFIDQADVRG